MSEEHIPAVPVTREQQLSNLVSDLTAQRIDRRSFITKATALGITLSAAGMILAACGGGSSSSGGGDAGGSAAAESVVVPDGATKQLIYRQAYDMAQVDPALWPTTDDGQLLDCINEGLISFKPGTFDVVNTLAESFEASDDNLEFTFVLKKGIQFHGGYGEVTAEDVKFSFERIAGLTTPKVESPYAGDWAALKEVKVTDTYSGVIVMKEAFAPLLRTTLPGSSGKVVSKKAVEKLGKKYGVNPIGTGPYEFVEWKPKDHILLKKFADYSGANKDYAEPAVFEEILSKVITEDSTASNALQAGDINYAFVGVATVQQLADAGFKVTEQATLNYQFLSISVADETLSDINVRKAIREAVDVQGIIDGAYDGKATRANAIIPENMGLGYWADAPAYGPDVAKAKEYLAASGKSDITLTLTTTNQETDKTTAEIIQANLKDIGITVEIDAQDSAAFYEIPGNGGGGKDRQLVYSGYTSLPDPSWSIVWFTKAQLGQWNWCDWTSPTFEANYKAGLAEFDEAKRNQIYIDMQTEWDESASMAWILFPNFYYSGQSYVKPSIQPNGWVALWNFGVV